MKKTTFITMVLTTISVVFFALGMCMALIPEWHAFRQGIVFGVIGLVLGLVTIIVYRRMTNKAPIEISKRMILFRTYDSYSHRRHSRNPDIRLRHVLHDDMEQHDSGHHPRPCRDNHPADAHSACERN